MKIKVNIAGTAFTGKIVTFTAPCNCTEATGLVIGEDTYDVVNALGECITGSYPAWVSGAQVSVVLDYENKKAYIQNKALGDTVKKSGDTMTGNLSIENAKPSIVLTSTANGDGVSYGTTGNRARIIVQNVAGETANGRILDFFNANGQANISSALRLIDVVDSKQTAYDILHTGNKSSGTYTGNGSAAARTIATGGIGNVCVVTCNGNKTVLVTHCGAFCIAHASGATAILPNSEARFSNGTLYLATATNDWLNYSQYTYNYQVL